MDTVKRSVTLLVVVTGCAMFGISDAYKTDRQIMTEIQSMAESITKHCTPDPVFYSCNAYTDDFKTTISIEESCSLIDSFTQCTTYSCKNQTQTLKQIIADAMIIPYCTILASFPRETSYWAVADRLSNMSRLCQFKPQMNCDLELGNFFASQYLFSLCLYERYYALCLEQKCLNLSLELEEKIEEAKDDSMCDFFMLPTSYPFTPDDTLDETMIAVPIPYDYTTTITTTTSTSTTVQGGGTTVGAEESKLIHIISLNDAMGRYCVIGSYYTGCSDEKHKVQSHVTLQGACGDEKHYIDCMETNCKSPSSVLRDQIYEVKGLCGSCSLLRVSLLAILTSLLAICT